VASIALFCYRRRSESRRRESGRAQTKVEAQRKDVALDCFGIGWEGYDDQILEALSRNGDGRYGFVGTPEEAATEFARPRRRPALGGIRCKVQVEFNPQRVTAYRQIG
jgi:hypothetical protein